MSRPSDPQTELEAILSEIAADSEAYLLRVPAAALMGLTNEEPVSSSASILTMAERHLLRVHREELGELLRQRCVMEFFAQPGAESMWHKSVTVDQQLEVPAEETWRERADNALSIRLGKGEGALVAEDALSRCIRGSELRPVTITQLALASLRVAPTDKARIYVAMELLREGHLSEARRAYEGVLAQRPKALLGAYCLEGIGVILSRDGRFEEAQLAFRNSFETEERPIPLMSWFVASALLGHRSEALSAAAAIDATLPPDHPALEWYVRANREHILRGTLVLTHAAKTSALSLMNVVNPAARRILGELVYAELIPAQIGGTGPPRYAHRNEDNWILSKV